MMKSAWADWLVDTTRSQVVSTNQSDLRNDFTVEARGTIRKWNDALLFSFSTRGCNPLKTSKIFLVLFLVGTLLVLGIGAVIGVINYNEYTAVGNGDGKRGAGVTSAVIELTLESRHMRRIISPITRVFVQHFIYGNNRRSSKLWPTCQPAGVECCIQT